MCQALVGIPLLRRHETSRAFLDARKCTAYGEGPHVHFAGLAAELLFTQFSGRMDWVLKRSSTEVAGYGEQQL